MADGKVVIDIDAESNGFKGELDEVSEEAKNGAKGLDDLGDSAKDAGKDLDALDVAAGDLIANGLQSLISSVVEAASSIVALAQETREYREDMAKLEAAFSTAGHSTDTASKAYEDMFSLLGESDQSVEAANHLAGLVESEKDLDKWSNIAAGTLAVFQDSLPLESLTESAAQTSELGKLTGPLVDVLSRAGISEEEFNKQLSECADQQERAALITETLNGKYAAAGKEYKELTKSTREANSATSDMQQAQAELGDAIEPVTTAWTKLKAKALETLIPVVNAVVDGMTNLNKWLKENPEKAEVLKGVLLGIAVALGVLATALGIQALIGTVTKAFAALNAVIALNPVVFIVAAIAGLVAAFIYLWNNCEGFRTFWISLWITIKEIAASVATWFSTTWATVVEWAKSAWTSFGEFWSNLWAGVTEWLSGAVESIVGFFTVTIPGAIDTVKEWFAGLVDTIIEFATVTIPDFIESVGEWFLQLPERIAYALGYAIGTIIQFGIDLWEFATVDVPKFIDEVISWFASLPKKIWKWLEKTIEKVSDWAKTTAEQATEAASNFIDNTIEFFSQLPGKVWGWLNNTLTKIAEWVKNATDKAIEAGSNFLDELINYFSKIPGRVWEWLENTVAKIVEFGTNAKNKATEAATGVYNAIVDGVKELPDKMMTIGSDIVSGIWEGISSGWDWLTDQVKSLANSLFEGAKDALDINSPSKKFQYVGEMSAAGVGVGWEDEIGNAEKRMTGDLSGLTARIQASVGAESVRMGQNMGREETGFSDLARAVGVQTAGINSLSAEYRRGSGNNRPIVLQLDKRELGRAVVDVYGTEATRVGLALGGA